MHRLSASLPIIGIGHLTVGIGRLFVLVSKTTKNAFNCIDDNEITNDSVITNQSRIIFNIQQNKVKTKE